MTPRSPASRHAAPAETIGATSRFFVNTAFLAAAGLVAVVPLVFSRVAFEMFRGPKSDLAFALWAALAASALGLVGRRVVTDAWQWPVLAVLAAGVASAPAARNPVGVLAALAPVAAASLGIAALRALDAARRERLERLVVIGGV
ncbi:MAG: hypothetical protein GW878_04180, partial [Acidobacteria bacterium]|nr:hypothetical protein [Acidobacteriota bacterium]